MTTARSTSSTKANRRRRCKAKTKAGKRCKSPPLNGADTCLAHVRKGEDRRGFGGPQPGSGRPRLPKPHERMRELVEENIDALVAPYLDAIQNTVIVAKFEGEVLPSDHPDLAARIAAVERLLDRVYGKPSQQVELAGSETSPPLSIVAGDDRQVQDAARAFLAKLIPQA